MAVSKFTFADEPTWADAVARRVATHLNNALTKSAEATLVVPGGRTAARVLPRLIGAQLPWERIAITLTDERWVDENHPDSNARLIREIMAPVLSAARFVGLKTAAPSPQAGLAEATAAIERLPRPFGCVLLGMGEDGHIASLFPGEAAQGGILQAAQRNDHPRISMTPGTLLNARAIIVAINGPEKCGVIDRALTPGPVTDLPVRHVLQQCETPVSVLSC